MYESNSTFLYLLYYLEYCVFFPELHTDVRRHRNSWIYLRTHTHSMQIQWGVSHSESTTLFTSFTRSRALRQSCSVSLYVNASSPAFLHVLFYFLSCSLSPLSMHQIQFTCDIFFIEPETSQNPVLQVCMSICLHTNVSGNIKHVCRIFSRILKVI